MKTFPTIEKLVAVATKNGFNPKDAAVVIKKNYEYLKEYNNNLSPIRLVQVAYTLY